MKGHVVHMWLVVLTSTLLVVSLFLGVGPFPDVSPSALWLKATPRHDSQQQRLTDLHKVCGQLKARLATRAVPLLTSLQPATASRIYVDDRYSLLYCEVPKSGCTNWKRILLALSRGNNASMSFTAGQVHLVRNYTKLSSFDAAGQRSRLDSYTMAMFVREPMERLVSAYRDKFLYEEDAYYRRVYGRGIIASYRRNASKESRIRGHDVTFPELVRFILDPRYSAYQDVHWLPINRLCQPCFLRYGFVGKLETVGRDAASLLARVGAPRWISYSDPVTKRSSANVTHRYLAQLSPGARRKLYKLYYEDYRLFGYSAPHGVDIKQRD